MKMVVVFFLLLLGGNCNAFFPYPEVKCRDYDDKACIWVYIILYDKELYKPVKKLLSEFERVVVISAINYAGVRCLLIAGITKELLIKRYDVSVNLSDESVLGFREYTEEEFRKYEKRSCQPYWTKE